MTYDADDHLRQVTRPNGRRTVGTFDAADQVTEARDGDRDTTLASFGYAYDDVGNVARRLQRGGDASTTTTTRTTRCAG